MPTLQNNTHTSPSTLNGVVVILLFDFLPQYRSWAWLRLVQGTNHFYKTLPGLLFAKVMGSGEDGGFGFRPSSTHQGLIFVFDGIKNATNYLNSSELLLYQEKAREWWQGLMAVNSCRGSWTNQSWASSSVLDKAPPAEHLGPVASLTRGSIRATKAVSFWRYAPPAQIDLEQAQGCQLAIGLGEAPLLRQCTFSLWSNTQALIDYAHQGAHQRAIAAAKKHSFFTESMFVRMQVLHMRGQWKGRQFNSTSRVFEENAIDAHTA